MDVCPSLPPVKLVGDEPKLRSHHAAQFNALGRRSAGCNLCFMFVIVLIYLIALSSNLRERSFISQLSLSCQEVFQNISVHIFGSPNFTSRCLSATLN